jgi:glycosyltransferase involved in cell wall biosynthesis
MKIALVYDLAYPFSIGGVEARNFSLAKHLALKGHEIHMFSVKHWKGDDIISIGDRIFLHGISHYRQKYGFSGKRNIFEPAKYSFFLFFELLKHDFDMIDVSAFPYFPAIVCMLSSIFKKRKIIITWHEVWNEYWDSYYPGIVASIGKFTERAIARASRNNISVSSNTMARLEAIGARSILIDNWVEHEQVLAGNIKKQKKRYDIISVGRHLKHKNFDMVLKVCSMLSMGKKGFRALLIGDGPETPHLLKLKESLKLDNVDILCFSKDQKKLYEYLSSSKVFVLLSEIEGFSIVSFEAMALGLPVITLKAKTNGLSGYVKDGYNGYVCSKNAAEIAVRIESLLRDDDELRKMGANAQDFSGRFSVQNISLIEKAYKEAR